MELDMRSKLCAVAVVTFAAMAGCNSSTGIRDCNAPTTTAAFLNEVSITATVTEISVTGQTRLIEVAMAGPPPGKKTFIVAGTTAVFERVGEGAPRASSSCGLAIGEVLEIPLFDGFGDFDGDVPTTTLSQVVIER
jgi:hypothetical protein